MEQITASTENGVELSEVTEVIAATVEEVTPVVEVIAATVEEVNSVVEVVAATVEEAAPIVEEEAPIVEVVVATVEEANSVVEVVAATVEEVKSVAEVVVATVEEVNSVVEVIAVIEEVSPVVEVVAVIEEVKSVAEVVTATVEEATEIVEVIVNTLEEANSLTATQKEALDIVFNDVKGTVEHIMIDADVPLQIKIMQMISPIMKTVQDVSVLKLALTGADKKAIVLECGRKCIRMMLKDHQDMLMMYDTIAEPALETMLDLSRNLKSVLKQIEKKEPSPTCCLEVLVACMGLKK